MSAQRIAGPRWIAVCFVLLVSGCILKTPDPSVTRVTQVDAKQATPDYWLAQPAVVHVDCDDFFKLWHTCRVVAHNRFFIIDREEYREGLMTTRPLVSKVAMEVWRRDAVTVPDIEVSTLATMRRTIFFQINRRAGGGFSVEPRVLVERFASAERRLTAITEYHTAFGGPRPYGSAENDQGIALPTDYWYATGRDNALERDLAASIQSDLPG